MSLFDNIRTTHNPNEKGVVLTEEESVDFLASLNASRVNPFKIGDCPLCGMQRYRVLDITDTHCLLAIKGGNKWKHIDDLED